MPLDHQKAWQPFFLSRRINRFLLDHLSFLLLRFVREQEKGDRLLSLYFRRQKIGKRDRLWLRERFYLFVRHRFLFERLSELCSVSSAEVVAEWAAGRLSSHCVTHYRHLKEEERFFALYHSFPRWFSRRLFRFRPESSALLLPWLNSKAAVVLRINRQKTDRAAFIRLLTEQCHCFAAPTPLSPDGVIVYGTTTQLAQSRLFHDGLFEFQDESSQLTAFLLSSDSGSVLDACAGGGGKSLALLNRFPTIQLTASDIRTALFPEISERAKRAGYTITTVKPNAISGQYDTIFLDMPCSGTGVLRRNPEDRWRVTERMLKQLQKQQRELLERYADLVTQGGEIVYVTCSVLEEENEMVVGDFLEKHPEFSLISAEQRMQQNGVASVREVCEGPYFKPRAGWERDLFFGAVLKKRMS